MNPEWEEFACWGCRRLGLRWEGFRPVFGQVRKRIYRRLRQLDLASPADYRRFIENNPWELDHLAFCFRITISRFFRERPVWEALEKVVLPELVQRLTARGERTLRAWSLGCASGEEPYSLAMLWHSGPLRSALALRILATDVDPRLLERAARARYPQGSLREVPDPILQRCFSKQADQFRVRPAVTRYVQFRLQNWRDHSPEEGPFHLIFCRYLVFTYADIALQEQFLEEVAASLHPLGWLVVGQKETLPARALVQWKQGPLPALWQRRRKEGDQP